MAGTDFFDDDLVRQRESAKRIKLGPGDDAIDRAGELPDSGDVPVRPVSDFNLTRMARHRKEVDAQSAMAAQELERLRKRQEQLEQERRELEDLRRRQDEYERGKREITELLKRSLVTLERKEVDAQRMVELLSVTRARFKELLGVVEELQEEGWPEDRIRDELAKSLGVLEQARMEYSKAMAKIEAVKADAPAAPAGPPAVIFDERGFAGEEERSFAHWLKIGLAVSLPVTVAILIVGLLFFFVIYAGYV
jgi:hypothetical protein